MGVGVSVMNGGGGCGSLRGCRDVTSHVMRGVMLKLLRRSWKPPSSCQWVVWAGMQTLKKNLIEIIKKTYSEDLNTRHVQ